MRLISTGFCLELSNSYRSLQAAITGDLRLDLHQFREMHQLFQRRVLSPDKGAGHLEMGPFLTLPGQRGLLKDYMLKTAKFRCYRKWADSEKTFFMSATDLNKRSVRSNILIKHNF